MAAADTRLNLKVLSPSTEVNGDISFNDISASTTVADLKGLIQTAIASRPAVERMRLIHRGRVLARESDTLSDVFGAETVRLSPNQSLHLVLRELYPPTNPPNSTIRNASQSPVRPSTVPPQNPFRQTPPTPQTNPFRPPQLRPASQPQIPHAHLHPHHHHHHHHPVPGPNPFMPFPIAPPDMQLVQQRIAEAMAQAQNTGILPAGATQNPTFLPVNTSANTQGPTVQSQGEGNTSEARNDTSAPTPTSGPEPPPQTANSPPQATRTVRHEAIGPNGERWTMTINSGNITIPLQPPIGQQPPVFPPRILHPLRVPPHLNPSAHIGRSQSPVNSATDRELQRVQSGLEGAQREMDNVRILLEGAYGDNRPPTWRHDEVRVHMDGLMRNLDQMQVGLSALAADPDLARNRTVLSLQILSNNLRSETGNLVEMIDQRLRSTASNPPSSGMPTPASSTASANPQAPAQVSQDIASHNGLSVFGPELFVLSSPQGPVGILFDERGTYRTAPFAPPLSLPFQTYNQQFAVNRQILQAVGQQMALLQNPMGAAGVAAAPPANANPNANAAAPNIQAGAAAPLLAQAMFRQGQQDRLAVFFSHAWLLFKLLLFFYFFSGSGSWYRPVMMGLAAAGLYLAQAGIFEVQFERLRTYFERMFGLGDEHPPPPNRQDNANANEIDQQIGAGGVPTPEQAAQRMVERRQLWWRDRLRTAERAFALFVASLWPGLGERMVQAQEERVRAQRAAEEERIRQDQERQAEEERVRAEAEGGVEKEGGECGPIDKGKGKEKAEGGDAVVEAEGSESKPSAVGIEAEGASSA